MSFDRPVILCAHGTRSPDGRLAITSLIDAVRTRRPDLDVHEAYVDVQDPALARVADDLAGQNAILVPLLLSTGYHVRVDLERAADRAGATLVPPLGPDPRLSDLLNDALGRLGPDVDVVLAAAGSSEERADLDLRAAATDLERVLDRPVRHAHASGGRPRLDDVLNELDRAGRRVAVASYLLAPGHFSHRLADSRADRVTAPFLSPTDPTPAPLVDLVLDRIDAATTGTD